MLARFTTLLPFALDVIEGDFPPHSFAQGEYRITIEPLAQSIIDPLGFTPRNMIAGRLVIDGMQPASKPMRLEDRKINGQSVIPSNLFRAIFQKPTFDRRTMPKELTPDAIFEWGEPSINLCFGVLNDWLDRVRMIGRLKRVHRIAPASAFWSVDYLHDDGSELDEESGFWRRKASVPFAFRMNAFTPETWRQASTLTPAYSPPGWDQVLLDARAVLPNVGAAVVLAFTALETFIADVLNQLSAKVEPPGLWSWINSRRLEPTVPEQFDTLLELFSEVSLKANPRLWEGFQNLRSARNSFVHGGVAMLGDQVVDAHRAGELVGRAEEIMDHVERLLPAEARRPFTRERIEWKGATKF